MSEVRKYTICLEVELDLSREKLQQYKRHTSGDDFQLRMVRSALTMNRSTARVCLKVHCGYCEELVPEDEARWDGKKWCCIYCDEDSCGVN